MKYIAFALFSLIKLSSTVYANNSVYIDMSYILSNSVHGKSILSELENINKVNVKSLETKENILKDLEKNISNQQNILSKDELDNKINDLKNKILIFRKDKDKLSLEFNDLKNKKIKDFMKKIEPIISKYIKKNSINIVLDKKDVIIGKKDHDITFEILELVNKNIE